MEISLTFEQIIDFLLDAPLFDRLGPKGLADIARLIEVYRLDAGEVLFEEGDQGDAWFVVYEGEARVSKRGPDGAPRDIADLRVRSCFGEMAVLDGSPRSATIRAITDLTVLRFSRQAFQELWDEGNAAAHELVLAMARVLCERQRQMTARVEGLLGGSGATDSRRALEDLATASRVSE